ncbi:antitoxin VbhA family protein [Piscibacillus sp. B03]|uniref:antitoxin VbhA family protein n=1 Tax=Piscibacillus sp. B03 TaxID=3457430 RepID=UPI003FCCF05F
MKKLSQEEFEQSFAHVKHQLEIEGFEVTEEDKEVIRKVAMGEMSREELIEQLKEGN